jgi:phage terminase large subunit GpA-like protein
VHFHAELGADYFQQLTAEKQVTKYVKGFPVREWVKKSGARNEALDTAVYSYAALQSLYLRFNRRTIWDQFERALKLKNVTDGEKQTQSTAKPQARIISQRKQSFVTDWNS